MGFLEKMNIIELLGLSLVLEFVENIYESAEL